MTSNFRIEQATGANVAERWRKQYQHANGTWGATTHGSTEETYKKLLTCGEDVTAIAAIIGTPWTHVLCSSCHNYVTRAATFGFDEDFGPHYLCGACIKEISTGWDVP